MEREDLREIRKPRCKATNAKGYNRVPWLEPKKTPPDYGQRPRVWPFGLGQADDTRNCSAGLGFAPVNPTRPNMLTPRELEQKFWKSLKSDMTMMIGVSKTAMHGR